MNIKLLTPTVALGMPGRPYHCEADGETREVHAYAHTDVLMLRGHDAMMESGARYVSPPPLPLCRDRFFVYSVHLLCRARLFFLTRSTRCAGPSFSHSCHALCLHRIQTYLWLTSPLSTVSMVDYQHEVWPWLQSIAVQSRGSGPRIRGAAS